MSVGARRLVKFLHEIGTVGLMGAAVAQLVLGMAAQGLPPVEFAAVRGAILVLSKWILLPSLLLVLLSGLWALAASTAFHNAGWAWLKAAMTVLVLEGTLIAVQGPAKVAAEIAIEIAAGDEARVQRLEEVLSHERGGLWVILFLCAANVALAVWRPRFKRRRSELKTES